MQLDFIIHYYHDQTHNYDIVIGAIANDQIYNYIVGYMNVVITRDLF